MKEITLDELISRNYQVRDYTQRNIDRAKELAVKVSEFHEAYPMTSIFEEDGNIYVNDYAIVKLKHPTLDFEISYSDFNRKYSIYLRTINSIPNLSEHSKQAVYNEFVEPNQIGILTVKKIDAWIKYYEEVYAKMLEKSASNASVINKFMESIKDLPVRWLNKHDGNRNGEIIRNGIKFSFSIGEEYVSKKIEIHYEVSSELANFLSLSDNKYVKSKISV